MLPGREANEQQAGDAMAGYIELEVVKRDREACEALGVLLRIIMNRVDKADLVASEFDHLLGQSTVETVSVPDDNQFDLVRSALRALEAPHLPLSAISGATDDQPLVRLVCYRNGCANELVLSDDEFTVEYFNPRPNSSSRMIYRTESAARLIHRSTGTVTVSDGARSRHRNLDQARRMLSAKLMDDATPLLLSGRAIRALQQSPDLNKR
jgi:hypothetical protein